MTGKNNIVVKKDKKHNNKNLSQIKYYTCHKKGPYASKCIDRELKN